jgi:hypothetical protein
MADTEAFKLAEDSDPIKLRRDRRSGPGEDSHLAGRFLAKKTCRCSRFPAGLNCDGLWKMLGRRGTVWLVEPGGGLGR